MLPPGDQELFEALTGGAGERQRRAVAKAITLIESTRPEHAARAEALLAVLPVPARPTLRLGVSGVPGVGKSTFVETLGLQLVGRGHRVAVLAVDPSSSVSGGSILGDKTRMERLSVQPNAFVRPSPSRGTLGGVAAATREAIRVVEAAGYDVVVVETVGVGQSEAAVAAITDVFVLLQLPNAGDELQAIKKGVMELADLVVVNKADLDPDAAARAVGQLRSAVSSSGRHGGSAPAAEVLATSALDPVAVDAVWQAIEAYRAAAAAGDGIAARRRAQGRTWLWQRIDDGLQRAFRADAEVQRRLPGVLDAVDHGQLSPSTAARRLLDAFDYRRDSAPGHE
ncbi:MAG: methylmalonyl Co-A mutase-associated GTPase MeaB [Caldimonas sp.]